MAASVLSGAVFGAALVGSGVYRPDIILAQLKLEDFHMLQVFLTAAATSTLSLSLLRKVDFINPPPRSAASYGIFGRYDGNIIGGSILGIGMAATGSCPGTVLAQVGVGVQSGYYSLAGAVAAGIAWSGALRPLLQALATQSGLKQQEEQKPAVQGSDYGTMDGASAAATAPAPAPAKAPPTPLSLAELLGASPAVTSGALVLALMGVVFLLRSVASSKVQAVLLPPLLGGAAIGASQLVSMLLRRSMLGASVAYEDAGRVVWWLLQGGRDRWVSGPTSAANLSFVLGVVAGAWGLGSAFSLSGAAPTEVTALRAVLGGMAMVVGARMAGGCPSGHGISGLSLLSLSSFITIMAAFGVGILSATLLF